MPTKRKPREIGPARLGNRGEVINFDHLQATQVLEQSPDKVTEFAIAIVMDKHERTIRNWLSGRIKPRHREFINFAKALDVAPSQLLRKVDAEPC